LAPVLETKCKQVPPLWDRVLSIELVVPPAFVQEAKPDSKPPFMITFVGEM
jgi:hypothetical protein